jgi:SAM-dependent methyltransferase
MNYLAHQVEHVSAVDPLVMNQEIPLPLDLMQKYKESPAVWPWAAFGVDLGCGNGKKTRQMFSSLDMGGFAFDINSQLLTEAKDNVLMAFKGDVTSNQFLDEMTVQNHMAEWYGTVNMGGLLVNTPGNRSRVWQAMDRLLTPGGHVFISEVMRCDHSNAVMEKKMGEVDYAHFRESWEARYQNNEAIGLPYGTVVIAKPGNARILEWGSPTDLLKLISTADLPGSCFERLVEHQNTSELLAELRDQLGYEVVETRYSAVHSRVKGRLYPIVTVVARKPTVFRYRSGHVGEDRSKILKGSQ